MAQTSKLKAELTASNYEISKIEAITGLKLLPYIIEPLCFRMVDAGLIVEATEANEELYVKYNYAQVRLDTMTERIIAARRELLNACEIRQALLTEFQETWDASRVEEYGVRVHFGLYRVEAAVPLGILAMHQIFFRENCTLGDALNLDRDNGIVLLEVPYSRYAVRTFDTFISLLSWGIRDSLARVNPMEDCLRGLQAQCARFLAWEQSTFQLT